MLTLQIELFLLMLVGYVLSKKNMMSKAFRSGMTDLVLKLFLPAAIIKSFEIDITAEILYGCMSILIIAALIELVCWLLNHVLWNREPADVAVNCKYATMVSNAGFMGMPVAEGIFGSEGLLFASIFLIPVRICMWSFGIGMYAAGEKQNVLKNVMTHPCIIALEIGLVVAVLRSFGIFLPTAVSETIGLIGKCNTACCMIVIGGMLSETDILKSVNRVTLKYSLIRLIIIPCIVLLCTRLAHVDLLSANTAVILSAMPAPTTTAMLAAKYERDAESAVGLVTISTLLSIATLPVMAWLITII